MCNTNHNKSLGSGLTATHGVRKHIVSMTYKITGLFYQCLYDILYDVKLLYPGQFTYPEIFQDTEGLVLKVVGIHVEI